MKRILLTALSLILICLAGCSSINIKPVPLTGQFPKKFKKTVTVDINLKYLLYLPEDFDKSKEPLPLMLFLHGSGERGDNIEIVKYHGPPKLAAAGKNFPFIIVSPQCPEGERWVEKTDELNWLLDEIISKYKIDKKRIYLTGLSMGGYGTWALAIERPDRFAAIAPICGGGTPWQARKIKDIPTWVFHGAKDTVAPVSNSDNMVAALKKVGGNVKYTVYPNANHDSWTETYNNTKLYDWFLQQSK